MISNQIIDRVPGCAELIGWFGSWPRFLDSEVLGVQLNRSGLSRVSIYTFEWTGKVSAEGKCLLHKHVVVSFLLEQVSDCELAGFNHQNVINGIDLDEREGQYYLQLNDVFGVGGRIAAKSIQIEFSPGELQSADRTASS